MRDSGTSRHGEHCETVQHCELSLFTCNPKTLSVNINVFKWLNQPPTVLITRLCEVQSHSGVGNEEKNPCPGERRWSSPQCNVNDWAIPDNIVTCLRSLSLSVTSFLHQWNVYGFFWHRLVTPGFPWQIINDGHLDLTIRLFYSWCSLVATLH
jgi:hypothetical protein